MSPLKHSKSFAARMGRWSASHWKTAVFGWLAFVVLSVFVGMQVGTKQHRPERRERRRVPHRRQDHLATAGFAVDKNGESIEEQGEMVLVQSKTLTVEGSGLPGRDRGRGRRRCARSRR